jgi:hypothetical protein
MYEQFVSDKPGAENRSFESPVFELPRQCVSSNRH